ncbi:MAG: PIN domain-containing protein [Candidatus Hodarchaeales archaeon]
MKNEFSEYYRPTKKEFEEIWDSCDFIFDTNILLNLYRYSIDTKNTLIEIMEQIDDRLWIPYQVGFEYHTERISVIEKQKKAYDQIKKKLTDFQNEIEDELLKLCNNGRHPYINCDDFLSELKTVIKNFFVDLDEKKEKHPELLDNDPIRDKLTKLFTGRICDQLDPKEKEKVINQGEDRYKKQIPPGFKDDGFGDLLIWFEMINHAKKRKKSIIFVTDDGKEDWWYQYHGKTVGPRPELIKEILENAGVKFYMYSADKFMNYAKEYINSKVEQEAIEEAREIRLQEERVQQINKTAKLLRTLGASASNLGDQISPSTVADFYKTINANNDILNIAKMMGIPEYLRDASAISAMNEEMQKIAQNYKIPESWMNASAFSGMDEVASRASDAIASLNREMTLFGLRDLGIRSIVTEEELRKLRSNEVINDEEKSEDEKPNKDSDKAE